MHRTAYHNQIGTPNPGTIVVAERPPVSVDWPRSPRDNARAERRSSGRRVPQTSSERWRRPQKADLVALFAGASIFMTAIVTAWFFL